jgi:glycosyltransferase involved in cell wall biosynthesis
MTAGAAMDGALMSDTVEKPATAARPQIGLVGPLPPPAGGMAVQCRQLHDLLCGEGLEVRLVPSNAAYRPAWVEGLRGVRALFRLLPYLHALWRTAGAVDVMHVFANSGWAWHLYAAPAVWIGRVRAVPVIVNYRGGDAESFLRRAPPWVRWTLASADVCITPSGFLRDVFARHAIAARVIPNVVDLSLFHPASIRRHEQQAHIVVTRNLEPIYGIDTALQAFAIVSSRMSARMTVAGEGPERTRLEELAVRLGIADKVRFAGRLGRDAMAALYRDADLMLNASTVDNMPNAILEAYATGVPVVSTNAGGIPHIARDGDTALLVPAGDAQALAQAACRVLGDPELARRLAEQGLEQARGYAWSAVGRSWLELYDALARRARTAGQ